jgi:hypothetical protein
LYDLPLNQYLWVFVENGVLAFCFFTFFFVSINRRSSKKLLIGTMLVVLLFNNFFWFPEAITLFWILAALTTHPEIREKPGKRTRILTVVSLVAFIFFNIISFNRLLPKNWAKETGTRYDYGVWGMEKSWDGKTFQWTTDHAGIYLTLDQNGEAPGFFIACRAPLKYFNSNTQHVQIYWKEKRIREIHFTENNDVPIKIKSKPMEQGFLEIRVTPTFNPKKLKIGTDSRDLGILLIL